MVRTPQGNGNTSSRGTRVARLIQLTDCHLGPFPEYRLAGVRTLASFEEVLARIAADPQPPDLVVATGDIAAHGSPDAYLAFAERMGARGLPYAWLPGNHDDFQLMQASLGAAAPYRPLLEVANWRLLLLNTAVPKAVGGNLAAAELELATATLAREAGQPVAVFMHHPPTAVGCRWLDRQQVANGGTLAEILVRHDTVGAVFCGHIHQQATLDYAGTVLHATPSTCFQFAPHSDDFAVDTRPPGYRWIDLYDNGTLDTGVVWIEDTGEKVDTQVHGY